MEKDKAEAVPEADEQDKVYKRESYFHTDRRGTTLWEKKQRKSMWQEINNLGFGFMDNLNKTAQGTTEELKDVSEQEEHGSSIEGGAGSALGEAKGADPENKKAETGPSSLETKPAKKEERKKPKPKLMSMMSVQYPARKSLVDGELGLALPPTTEAQGEDEFFGQNKE